nr:hypothetical protein [Pyrinomonadaceae bacterium]
VAGGLLEGFRSVLPHGVYPVAFLFLEIPHDEIDVNVHPAKTEIRFRRSEAVKETIAEAVREALAKAGIVREEEATRRRGDEEIAGRQETERNFGFSGFQNESQFSEVKNQNENPVFQQAEIDFHSFETAKTDFSLTEPVQIEEKFETEKIKFTEQTLPNQNEFEPEIFSNDFEQKANVLSFEKPNFETETNEIPSFTANDERRTTTNEQPANYAFLPPVNTAEKVVKSAEVADFKASKIRPIGQLYDSFIIAVDDEGMLLIDQHVAHERILFDKFRKKETERKIESQNLLLPETFDLTPAQSQAFSIIEEELENLGFGLMRLSGRTIAIKSVPTDLPPSEARNLLAEILDTVDAEKRGSAKASLRDNIAASLACKAAVKINMKLTPEKMQWLIDRLMFTSSPTTCPHGRPVILRLTMKDIERGFHRT